MKRTLITILLLAASAPASSAADYSVDFAKVAAQTGPDCSKLTAGNHPRLFFTEKSFKDLKKQISKGTDEPLVRLHESMMGIARKHGLSDKQITFDRVTAKSVFNNTARVIATRIISDAYAYRLTGERPYLDKAVEHINLFADNFWDWTTNYWLENSEVCSSFALAYDWLYDDLSQQTKDKIVKAIATIGYEDSRNPKKNTWYTNNGNWNPVCNASLVLAAIATYERHPEESAAIIEKAIETVPIAIKSYDPDGVSHEGPSYWDYANNFAAMLGMVMLDNFGSDFGVFNSDGYIKGATYRVFAVGNTGLFFNYADCNYTGADMCMALWYFAWRYGRTDLLFRDIESLKKHDVHGTRGLPMAIACAQRMGKIRTSVPEELFFSGHGDAEIVIARGGWGENDAFLGLKGGKCKTGHSHMDEGCFIYETDGVRWIDEFIHPTYENYRRAVRALRKEKIEVKWYDQFVYNNRRHSTLTINDSDMNEDGFAPLVETFDTPARRGGTLDLTDMYKGQTAAAKRTAALIDGHDLEIIDEVTALKDKPARVRFTLVTPAEAKITDEGIILSLKGKKMLVKADGKVTYMTWTSDPKEYTDSPLRRFEEKGRIWFNMCGFEFDVPAGGSAGMTTRFTIIR